jgi:hypothetical protein
MPIAAPKPAGGFATKTAVRSGDPEIVFKFRNPNRQKAAQTDVRSRILGDDRVKFKAQALPLEGQLGGIRMLYSHTVQFPRSNVSETDSVVMSKVRLVQSAVEDT